MALCAGNNYNLTKKYQSKREKMLANRSGYSTAELSEHDVEFPKGDGTTEKQAWKHKTQNANPKGIRSRHDYYWIDDPIIQGWF
jgi:hypothetical protein